MIIIIMTEIIKLIYSHDVTRMEIKMVFIDVNIIPRLNIPKVIETCIK